ncbi:transposable element Tcb1 transposase [Trichonephila clavipes]|nr:transposable element Tcb1 transposase [Trichonephila clavipes]
MSRRQQQSAFDQVTEFDRGRIVAYRDCGLSFRKVGSRVGRNQRTVMRICDRWMQEGTTDRCSRLHPPQCTTSLSARNIRRRLQQSGLSTRRPLLGLHLTQNHRRLHRQWCDDKRMWVAEWNEVVFTDESRICCNITMVGFESGDTVERGWCTAALCIATLVLHRVLCYEAVLDITLVLL